MKKLQDPGLKSRELEKKNYFSLQGWRAQYTNVIFTQDKASLV